MIIRCDRTGSVSAFHALVAELSQTEAVKSILILACDHNGFIPETINPIMREIPKPVFGGIFPEIINGCERLSMGSIVVGFPYEARIEVVPRLSDYIVGDALLNEHPWGNDNKTMFAFVDGFAQGITAFLNTLVQTYSLDMSYIGGGAGSLSFVRKPCLFAPEGLIQGEAVLSLVAMKSGVGVSHGWNSIAGPFRVTQSQGNTIVQLDNQPAFKVYRDIVQDHARQVFTDDNFFEIAKCYPFGINKLPADRIVRDPVKVGEGDSLICVGEVPQECLVYILNGDQDSLVSAARYATLLGENSFLTKTEHKAILLMDCISRLLFLDDYFDYELDAVAHDELPMIGAATIGEIAIHFNCLEFHNKTSVVGILQDSAT